ncbi:MAG: hypothetical protein HOP08_06405 [Cyclobacteriaceae bacterium]|nr:hypothetical protein [Cyclobacteriaceae bacterium]
MKVALLILSAILYAEWAQAQFTNRENYDLKNPGNDRNSRCKDFFLAQRSQPEEARFSTFIKGDSVLVTHSDADWFWKLIPGKNDGIAIDLISQGQYSCDNIERRATSWSHTGFLLPPMYRDEIIANLIPVKKGYIAFLAGKVPSSLNAQNVEANYMILESKYMCFYTNIVNVDYHGWNLLKNGLYYDTLNAEELEQKYKDISKTLHFTIPFEKDKWEFSKQDISPLYDSLRLTDYTIKDIRIHTYTSVEGSTARNQKLQTLRAESIVKALQSFQSEKLESSILSSENWVEFLEDINGGTYSSLMSLSKDEIKEKLKSPDLLTKLEPILKHHRKAIIELDLEKRVLYLKSNGEELKKYFNQQLTKHNIEEALYLQQIIFYKIQRHELPNEYLNDLDLPEAIEYGSLLLNNASFRFENSIYNIYEAIKTFEKLSELLKDNPKIKYNLCALRLQSWINSPKIVNHLLLKKEIENLSKIGIPGLLVKRLLINYYVIFSEISLDQRKYADKDNAVKFIYNSYKPLELTDEDLLNLAKFFSHNSRFDWAEKILEPRIKNLEVSEDILFYYLSLTIFDEANTKGQQYRTVMLNAVNANQDRFCQLFNSREKGGVSFQLLRDAYLKKTFCENCQDNIVQK